MRLYSVRLLQLIVYHFLDTIKYKNGSIRKGDLISHISYNVNKKYETKLNTPQNYDRKSTVLDQTIFMCKSS